MKVSEAYEKLKNKLQMSTKGVLGLDIPQNIMIGIVGFVVTLLILAGLQFDTTVAGSTEAQTAVNNSLQMGQNVTSQFALMGTILSYVFLIAVVGLIGVGAFFLLGGSVGTKKFK